MRGRPASVIPAVKFHIRLPVDVKVQLDLYLFSELEGRVPYGAYTKFFEERAREFFDRLKEVTDAPHR